QGGERRMKNKNSWIVKLGSLIVASLVVGAVGCSSSDSKKTHRAKDGTILGTDDGSGGTTGDGGGGAGGTGTVGTNKPSLALLNHLQFPATLSAITGVDASTPSVKAVVDNTISRLPQDGTAKTITSSQQQAMVTIAAAFCDAWITKESALPDAQRTV